MPRRSPVPGLRLIFGKPTPRHAGATLVSRRTKRIFSAILVAVALVDIVLVLFRMGHRANASPTMVLPLPAISFPTNPTNPTNSTGPANPAATPSPSGSPLPERTVRMTPKPSQTKPPAKPTAGEVHVLLGPSNLQAALNTYCQRTYGQMTMAYAAGGGWQCAQFFGQPRSIDMDAACRSLYDERAWSYLANDRDPQSWRCYRDGP